VLPLLSFSKIPLQFITHNSIFHILNQQQNRILQTHNDVLIIYVSKIPDIKNVLDDFNDIHPVLKVHNKGKSKGKVHAITGHEGPEGK
jgi:hypothetical protein